VGIVVHIIDLIIIILQEQVILDIITEDIMVDGITVGIMVDTTETITIGRVDTLQVIQKEPIMDHAEVVLPAVLFREKGEPPG
jgi:hypothetical protein